MPAGSIWSVGLTCRPEPPSWAISAWRTRFDTASPIPVNLRACVPDLRQIVPEDGGGLNRFVVAVRAIHAVLTILEEAQSASQRLAMEPKHLTHEQKDLVWRCVQVWRRFRRLADGYRSFASLEADLAQGSGMFLCGLLVQAEASSV